MGSWRRNTYVWEHCQNKCFQGAEELTLFLGGKGKQLPPSPPPHLRLGNREIGILTIHWQQTERKMAIQWH